MKELLDMFLTFAKIGGFTFGGGYAMLPILQREVVEKRHWATENELMDYYAIGQCTPGIIAVNTATFIGYKRKGYIGGIVATLGCIPDHHHDHYRISAKLFGISSGTARSCGHTCLCLCPDPRFRDQTGQEIHYQSARIYHRSRSILRFLFYGYLHDPLCCGCRCARHRDQTG